MLILKVVSGTRVSGAGLSVGGEESEAATERRLGWSAVFTAHDSRGSTPGQLVEGTVEVQLN